MSEKESQFVPKEHRGGFEQPEQKQGTPEITAEEREKVVEELEKMDYILDEDKAILLLVLAGEKPAGSLSIDFRPGEPGQSEEKFNQERESFERFMEENNIPYFSRESDVGVFDEGKEIVLRQSMFTLGGNPASLERAEQADSVKDPREFGNTMGYPETAVEAYAKEYTTGEVQLLKRDEYPVEVALSDESNFLFFRLSKDHWREEFETAKRWAQTVKEASPEIYERLTSRPLRREILEELKNNNPERFKQILESDSAMQYIKKKDEELYTELLSEKESL